MSAEPDALAVVTQLKDLAADPMNRRAIVQDQGCLPGLILFLDHPNPQVVYSALLVSCLTLRMKCGRVPAALSSDDCDWLTLQAIRYLAEFRANREKLNGELGMMLSLQNVVQKSTTPGETKLLASEIHELLQASGAADPEPPDEGAGGRRKAHFFLGSSNKRAKTVVLHIDGLDDSIRGVISFTFQMTVRRCIVRIRSDLKAEALASAIASTQVMTAQQVVKGENGDEVLIPFVEDGSVAVEQNVDVPDYLPEDESPSQEPDKAVTRVGSGQDGASWVGTAANFLSRSFYW
ncbi:hypothetical protein F2P81_000074 [Scophthalmus maximus]|uniref:Armadillo repeat-containing protein 1 n=1 Tax=Scophthalmus maximus TaxID=52904 RepID=A0A6A4TUT9_SCOMX|nr:hypothetical protein F2P81_000074 [Scophthalmus maximus]